MSVKEINPKETTRASAFELWMEAPNPMVTFFKTYDVMPLIKVSKKYDMKFNMLLDFCIGKAAASVKEFYLLPVGNKLIQYDKLAVNTIVANKDGEVSSCDIAYTDNLEKFNADYLRYTTEVQGTCFRKRKRGLYSRSLQAGNLLCASYSRSSYDMGIEWYSVCSASCRCAFCYYYDIYGYPSSQRIK